MGVESYTVRLTPNPHSDQPLMVEAVARTLRQSGFHRLALRTEFGPGHLMSPPENQAEYERRETDAVIEAVVFWGSSPGEPTRADRLAVTGIDIRFAVCQPPPAETLFRDTVERMVRSHGLGIQDGYSNRRYEADQFTAFFTDMTPLLASLRTNWQRLFGQGYEEKALSSAEAWSYYLHRQRSDREQAPRQQDSHEEIA